MATSPSLPSPLTQQIHELAHLSQIASLRGSCNCEILQQGDPIEERYKEYVNRGAVIDQFNRCVNSYREAAVSNDPRFDHIDISEKQKVVTRLSAPSCLQVTSSLTPV